MEQEQQQQGLSEEAALQNFKILLDLAVKKGNILNNATEAVGMFQATLVLEATIEEKNKLKKQLAESRENGTSRVPPVLDPAFKNQ